MPTPSLKFTSQGRVIRTRASGEIQDLGALTQRDVDLIKAGKPFITPQRKSQKLTALPSEQLFSTSQLRSGAFDPFKQARTALPPATGTQTSITPKIERPGAGVPFSVQGSKAIFLSDDAGKTIQLPNEASFETIFGDRDFSRVRDVTGFNSSIDAEAFTRNALQVTTSKEVEQFRRGLVGQGVLQPTIVQQVEAANPGVAANEAFVRGAFKAFHNRQPTTRELREMTGQLVGDVRSKIKAGSPITKKDDIRDPVDVEVLNRPSFDDIEFPDVSGDVDAVNNLTSNLGSFTDFFKQQFETTQAQINETLKQNNKLLEKRAELGTFSAQDLMTESLNELGINREVFEKKQSLITELDGLMRDINDLNTREQQRIEGARNLQAPMEFIRGEAAGIERQFAIKRAGLSAQAGAIATTMQALDNNIAQARAIAKDVVDAAVIDRKMALDEISFFMSRNDQIISSLSTEKQNALNNLLNFQMKEYELARQEKQQIMDWMIEYPEANWQGVNIKDLTVDDALDILVQRPTITGDPITLGNSDTGFYEYDTSTGQWNMIIAPGSDQDNVIVKEITRDGQLYFQGLNKLTGDLLYEVAAGDAKDTEPSASQFLVAGYARRIQNSHAVIKQFEDKFAGLFARGRKLPNWMKSEDRQRFEQAERDYINAVLRRESGAVISDEEFANARQQYIPQPGDKEKTLQQKAFNRSTVLESFIRESGAAFVSPTLDVPVDIGAIIDDALTEHPAMVVLGYIRNKFPDLSSEIEQRVERNETPISILEDLKKKSDIGTSGSITNISEAIGQFESGGNYSAVGNPTSKGNRAYGKYQIMDFNIPNWTQEALGRSMTTQEFLQDPNAQDKTAQFKMAQIFDRYGNFADVAAVWFSGRPASGNNAADVNGTTVPQYIQNVLALV